MVTKEKFTDMIMEDLHKFMPKEMLNACKIEKTYIRKDNDIVLTGICFNKGANMPSPTFYVDEAYKAFQNGESYDALINALVESAVEHWEMKAPIDIDNMDYDELKDKLVFQVVDVDHNRNRLKEHVSTTVANGLALIYKFEFRSENHIMRVPITKAMAEMFNYDIKTLEHDAIVNMERLYPAKLANPVAVMSEAVTGEKAENFLESEGIVLDDVAYVLTNDREELGASALFYNGMMEKIGNMVGGNYYVIPSSVNELMITPAMNAPAPREMLSTIAKGNAIFTNKETFLSDRLYMYNRGNGLLAQVTVPNRGVKLER